MPRNFPDMQSLRNAAHSWKFRAPNDGESDSDYRAALADFVKPQDMVESMEIRSGKGWDAWGDVEKVDMLRRGR
jgi:hypothetical protein